MSEAVVDDPLRARVEEPVVGPSALRRPVPDPMTWQAHQRKMRTTLLRIAKIERKVAALQAEQVELTAEFVDDRLRFDQEHGYLSDPGQYKAMVAEVAIAKHVSVTTAGIFMDDAWGLLHHNQRTLNALRTGRIGLPAARTITRETSLLESDQTRILADRVLAEDAPEVLPGKVRALAERVVNEVDPAATTRRRVREQADRHVALSPAGSAMAWLNAYLPAEQAAACDHSLQQEAVRRRAAGASATTAQLRCEVLVERLTGTRTDTTGANVNVIMTDSALLGSSDQPAHLVGVGPIPAWVARDLATRPTSWLRRFLTDPVDGSLTHGDTRRRRFDGALRDLIIARDQHCRGIQCGAPIHDIDHITPHAHGGPTILSNGQGISDGCHTSRNDPHLHVTPDTDTGVVTWTTPTGLTWRSLPPPSQVTGLDRTQRWFRRELLHPPNSHGERYLVRYAAHDIRHQRCRC